MAKNTSGLINAAMRTPEERSAMGKKGIKKSLEVRRKNAQRRKEFKATFETLLNMSIKTGKIEDVDNIQAFGQLNGKNITVNEALAVRVTQKALNGDLKAFELIRDSIGEKPIEKHMDVPPIIITGEDEIKE